MDTCTIGIDAAKLNAQILNEVGIEYLDSPVSGLKFRAEEGALVSMVSGQLRIKSTQTTRGIFASRSSRRYRTRSRTTDEGFE
ncbi:MAG: hypothetical protein CM15mP62_17840 [Rhodospirillaceae bacterium]|nr:MAG: hypothetical protein CM15mP62_17840 [Rhodospirillaceae bacterium]